jgi:hypothetical protein
MTSPQLYAPRRLFFILILGALLSVAAAATLPLVGARAERSEMPTAGRRQPPLSFEARVAYQRAVEEVYWRHQA